MTICCECGTRKTYSNTNGKHFHWYNKNKKKNKKEKICGLCYSRIKARILAPLKELRQDFIDTLTVDDLVALVKRDMEEER